MTQTGERQPSAEWSGARRRRHLRGRGAMKESAPSTASGRMWGGFRRWPSRSGGWRGAGRGAASAYSTARGGWVAAAAEEGGAAAGGWEGWLGMGFGRSVGRVRMLSPDPTCRWVNRTRTRPRPRPAANHRWRCSRRGAVIGRDEQPCAAQAFRV